MSDSDFNLGGDSFANVPPLTAEERKVMKEIAIALEEAHTRFTTWMRSAGQHGASTEVILRHKTLTGAPLETLKAISEIAVKALNLMTETELAQKIIEFGVLALNESLNAHAMGDLMKLRQIASLPPEMQEGAMALRSREALKRYMDVSTKRLASELQFQGLPEVPPSSTAPAAPQGKAASQASAPAPAPVPANCCNRCCQPFTKANAEFKDPDTLLGYHMDCLIEVKRPKQEGGAT